MRLIALVGITAVSALMAADTVAPLGTYKPAERRHWAFVKPSHPQIPVFTDASETAWIRTPVDAFILARLKQEGLKPAPSADRATLIRRLYFDLTGLPPTPAEVEAFFEDPRRWRMKTSSSGCWQPALWRALGPALARRGSLCGDRRIRVRQLCARTVALSRLGDRVAQRGQAV